MSASINLAAGAALRYLLRSDALQQTLQDRVEIATPLTSWKRLREGLFLYQHGRDPYAGGVFHQAPLLLMLFDLVNCHKAFIVDALYICVDLAAAWMLYQIALMRQQHSPKDAAARISSALVSVLYLFHPFLLATTLSRSTLSFSHLVTIASLFHAMRKQLHASMLCLAVAAHLSVYPCLLLPPVTMLHAQYSQRRLSAGSFAPAIAVFTATSLGLAALSRLFLGSWSFLHFYNVVVAVTDLTPNIGLSWYFFIEMFDHFRPFFLGVFQLHVAIYVAPICIKLKNEPLMASTILLGIIATFKSYPSAGDIALFHVLLFLFPERLFYTRRAFVSVAMVIYCIALMPAFHYLWLYAGSGNANFYYATTLVFGVANGLAVGDAFFAALRYDFGQAYGVKADATVVQR